MIDLVKSVVNETDVDPILQLILLKQVIKPAGEGSEPFRIAFEGIMQQLDKAKIDLTVDWTNPADGRGDEARQQADKLIASVRTQVPSEIRVTAARNHLERIVLYTHRTVGWLVRDQGEYQLKTGVALPGGELWVVVPHSKEKRGEWKKVGSISDNKKTIDTTDPSALAEGRPVFMFLPAS